MNSRIREARLTGQPPGQYVVTIQPGQYFVLAEYVAGDLIQYYVCSIVFAHG